jgi:hypothetical protein
MHGARNVPDAVVLVALEWELERALPSNRLEDKG